MNLKDLAFKFATQAGLSQTNINGLELYRLDKPYPRTSIVAQSAICFILQGEKILYIGEKQHIYNSKKFLIGTVNMPIESEVREATADNPYLGIILRIDPFIVSDLLLEIGKDESIKLKHNTDTLLGSSYMNEDIEDCLFRLLKVADDSLKSKMLAKSIMRELYFYVLISEQGYTLRNSLANNANAHKMAPVIQYLVDNFKETIEIKDLAKNSGMSKSALYDNFKEATSLSPIQFVKQLRIHNAHKMLLEGESAAKSAFESGYSSQSQFSREFKRYFGYSPSHINDYVI